MIVEPKNYHEGVATCLLRTVMHGNLVRLVIRDKDVDRDTMEREIAWVWSSQAIEQIAAMLNDCYDMEDEV